MNTDSLIEEKDISDNPFNLTYEKEIIKFKNVSFIVIALAILALVLLFTIGFTYKSTGLGISLFLILILISIVAELININLTILQLKTLKQEKINKRIKIKCLKEIYYISFAAFALDIVECVFLIPFFSNYIISINEYNRFLPVLIILSLITLYLLRTLAHFRLKENTVYQFAENPLKNFSKKASIFIIILTILIVIFQVNFTVPVIVQLFMEYIILLPLFYGILSLYRFEEI